MTLRPGRRLRDICPRKSHHPSRPSMATCKAFETCARFCSWLPYTPQKRESEPSTTSRDSTRGSPLSSMDRWRYWYRLKILPGCLDSNSPGLSDDMLTAFTTPSEFSNYGLGINVGVDGYTVYSHGGGTGFRSRCTCPNLMQIAASANLIQMGRYRNTASDLAAVIIDNLDRQPNYETSLLVNDWRVHRPAPDKRRLLARDCGPAPGRDAATRRSASESDRPAASNTEQAAVPPQPACKRNARSRVCHCEPRSACLRSTMSIRLRQGHSSRELETSGLAGRSLAIRHTRDIGPLTHGLR